MLEKILSYNPRLLKGIEVYKDANRNFILLIFLGALLIHFPIISVPCCILSIFYIIKMLQFIRYNSIYNIAKELAKDLSVKGIYDKEKVEYMLEDFRFKYGDDVLEYTELVEVISKYEGLVTKIESVLKSITVNDNVSDKNESEIALSRVESHVSKDKGNKFTGRELSNPHGALNDKVSILYKKADGEVKKVNKAIEFFDNENNNPYNENALMLNDINNKNKNLKVYLYKKASVLEKNAL